MPRAVDTNVLVRALVEDGTEQTERVVRRFVSEDIFVPVSVVLETEWVLRSHLRLDRSTVNFLLTTIAGVHRIELENRGALLKALEAHRNGLDLADAVHLYCSGHCDALYTFDADFRRRAAALDAAMPVIAP
jgi:predicted nucleic-acid-binding protein